MGKDGDDLDAYVLGVDQPVESFSGKCITIIKRQNDLDDKLIVVPPDQAWLAEAILKETLFVEQYFESEIILAQN
jgi:inorganic pyrophosphatase